MYIIGLGWLENAYAVHMEGQSGKCLEQQVPKAGMVGSGHKRVYMSASSKQRHLTAFAFPPAAAVPPAN